MCSPLYNHGVIAWIRRVVLFLLLGAVVNVAVAWGCAIVRGDPSAGSRRMRYQGQGYRTFIDAATGFGCAFVIEYSPRVNGHAYSAPPIYSDRTWWEPNATTKMAAIAHIGCGWPMLALSARVRPTPASAGAEQRSIVIEDGFVLGAKALNPPRDETLPIILPYQPIWFGFAVNTGGFGGVLLAIFVVPGAIRRLVRRRQRRCPACGYPRGSSAVCSECGRLLKRSPGGAGG